MYIKLSQSVEVTNADVTLNEVAKLECSNKNILNRIKTLKILSMPGKPGERFIVSIMKVIEMIDKEYPGIQISNIGETDCVVEYGKGKPANNFLEILKVIFVCLIIFFGAAFAIMSFNNDVAAGEMFSQIYTQIMGEEKESFSIIELTYALGLGTGIIIFYNHFGPKKLSKDPTPIEVEMRLYENEINTTLIDGHNRNDGNIEVK